MVEQSLFLLITDVELYFLPYREWQQSYVKDY